MFKTSASNIFFKTVIHAYFNDFSEKIIILNFINSWYHIANNGGHAHINDMSIQ